MESRVAKSVRNKAKTAIKHRKKVEKFLFKSLGPGDRAFEPHYSDQNPSEINDFRGIFLFFVYCGADDDITPMLLYANTRHTQKYFIAIMPKLRYDTNIKNVELPRLQGIIWAKYYRFPY